MLHIIKIGGNIIDNPEALSKFLHEFASLTGPKILIHGGGKIATKLAADMGLETKMVDGRRITDKAMLDLVTMVYAGLINKQIVAGLQSNGCNALGLTGADGNTVPAQKRPVKDIDYGYVGDPVQDKVNTKALTDLLLAGFTPVFCALTHDGAGNMLNTNADTMASVLAVSMASAMPCTLAYCFELKGVLKDFNNKDSVISDITPETYQKLKTEGIVNAGMIPKLDNAFKAIDAGVNAVLICHADDLPAIINLREKKGTRLCKTTS